MCKIQSHKIERAMFKISTMTSVGNFEESIFLHGLALAWLWLDQANGHLKFFAIH